MKDLALFMEASKKQGTKNTETEIEKKKKNKRKRENQTNPKICGLVQRSKLGPLTCDEITQFLSDFSVIFYLPKLLNGTHKEEGVIDLDFCLYFSFFFFFFFFFFFSLPL